MFDVSGQMRMALRVGRDPAQEFPINPSLLDELLLIQNNLLKVPTIQITLHDDKGLQESLGVFADGSQFILDIGWNQADEPYRSHPFRVFSLPKQLSTEQGVKIQILGYLDIPRYFRKRWEMAFEGTSAELLQTIAAQNDLIAEVDETDDLQVWLPDGRSQADYARFVTGYGWRDNFSCMDLGITQISDLLPQTSFSIPWVLRYFNLTQKIQQDIPDVILTNHRFDGPGNVPVFNIMDLDIKSHSGFFNHWLGYGNRIGQEKLSGEYQEFQEVDIFRSAFKLQLNQELTNNLGVVRREVAPPDCGNTHTNFIRALHQNRRIKSQYSTVADVLCLNRTPLRLFDKVELHLAIQQSNSLNETYQGNYLVTAKTIAIRSGTYREKLELSGQGVNQDFEEILI